MEGLIKTIILGVIQGLTEWLPISSTGHLRLAEHFLGLDVPILFDVILHVGTLTVIFVFFRKEIGKTLSALTRLDFKTEYGEMTPLIIVGVIPTLLIGLVLGKVIEDTFQGVLPIATALILCGLLVYSTRVGRGETHRMGYMTAIVMGIAQGIAIIPGISRSGATIAVALLIGVRRKKAFEFSFLLSIPAILGALGLTIYTELDELVATNLELIEISAGLIAAVLVGYLALRLLWKTIAKEKFHLFSFYCWTLGAILILLSGVSSQF